MSKRQSAESVIEETLVSNVFVHPEDGKSSGISVRSFSQTLNHRQLWDRGRTGRGRGRVERR